jgi:hypothetical protein
MLVTPSPAQIPKPVAVFTSVTMETPNPSAAPDGLVFASAVEVPSIVIVSEPEFSIVLSPEPAWIP